MVQQIVFSSKTGWWISDIVLETYLKSIVYHSHPHASVSHHRSLWCRCSTPWYFFPFFSVTLTCPVFWLKPQPMWGGGVQPQLSLVPEVPGWRLVSRHVTVRVNSVPVGNRRLTLAASCLSCFVKAANLPFVAVDCSDKQTEKQRFFRDENKTRSWEGGGGFSFPRGVGVLVGAL